MTILQDIKSKSLPPDPTSFSEKSARIEMALLQKGGIAALEVYLAKKLEALLANAKQSLVLLKEFKKSKPNTNEYLAAVRNCDAFHRMATEFAEERYHKPLGATKKTIEYATALLNEIMFRVWANERERATYLLAVFNRLAIPANARFLLDKRAHYNVTLMGSETDLLDRLKEIEMRCNLAPTDNKLWNKLGWIIYDVIIQSREIGSMDLERAQFRRYHEIEEQIDDKNLKEKISTLEKLDKRLTEATPEWDRLVDLSIKDVDNHQYLSALRIIREADDAWKKASPDTPPNSELSKEYFAIIQTIVYRCGKDVRNAKDDARRISILALARLAMSTYLLWPRIWSAEQNKQVLVSYVYILHSFRHLVGLASLNTLMQIDIFKLDESVFARPERSSFKPLCIAEKIGIVSYTTLKAHWQKRSSQGDVMAYTVKILHACLARWPEERLYHYYLGMLLTWQKKTKEAMPHFRQAALHFWDKWWIWKKLADAFPVESVLRTGCLCKAYWVCQGAEDREHLISADKKRAIISLRSIDELSKAISSLSSIPPKGLTFKIKDALEFVDEKNNEDGTNLDWDQIASQKALALKAEETLSTEFPWIKATVCHVGKEPNVNRLSVLIQQASGLVVAEGFPVAVVGEVWPHGTPVTVRVIIGRKGPQLLCAKPRQGVKWDILPWESAVVSQRIPSRRLAILTLAGNKELRISDKEWRDASNWTPGDVIQVKALLNGSEPCIVAWKESKKLPDFVQILKGPVHRLGSDGSVWIGDVIIHRRLAVPLGLEMGMNVRVVALRSAGTVVPAWRALRAERI